MPCQIGVAFLAHVVERRAQIVVKVDVLLEASVVTKTKVRRQALWRTAALIFAVPDAMHSRYVVGYIRVVLWSGAVAVGPFTLHHMGAEDCDC